MATLLWLQRGACSGNTMSVLNAEEPSACDLVTDFGIDVLWHPSLCMELGDQVKTMLADIIAGRRPLDIFVSARRTAGPLDPRQGLSCELPRMVHGGPPTASCSSRSLSRRKSGDQALNDRTSRARCARGVPRRS